LDGLITPGSSKAIDYWRIAAIAAEYPDIAIVPIVAERAASRQFVVAESYHQYKDNRNQPIPLVEDFDVTIFDKRDRTAHFSGKKRFVGYRVGQIFYVLWVDPTFQVYDH
jgi:hypothetical protein